MAEPAEGEPGYWFPRPPGAYWVDSDVLNSRRGWYVEQTPPPPWPLIEGQPDRDVYGPPGTRWLYYSDDVFDFLNLGPDDATNALLLRALKVLKRRFLAPAQRYTWVVPGAREWELMAVQVVRSSIHAQLGGTEEELVHVLHWLPGPAVGLDAAGMVDFATTVQAGWTIFVSQISGLLYSGTIYDYVACALITLDPPDDPEYDVPTEYVNFVAPTNGSGSNALPNEVAMCVSHRTARRGARYRGRTYLGGLTETSTESNGRFMISGTTNVRDAWIAFVNYVAINAGATFVVASGKFGTAEPVTNELVGDVPDSMRSRRFQQTEAYVGAPLTP